MARKEIADISELSAANGAGGQRSIQSVPNNGRHKQEGVPIYTSKGNEIGRVVNGVFYKRVRGSKHMLRRPPAWAFDVVSLKQAERAGARLVTVIDAESGAEYTTPLPRIWERGREFNRGYGDQIFMVISDWDTKGDAMNNPRPTRRRPKTQAIIEPTHVQMSLFGRIS